MTSNAPKQNTKSRIRDIATILFAERGYHGVSLDDIAREIGLSKQALLHHYRSKDKLYGTVLKHISDAFLALLSTQNPSPDQTRSEEPHRDRLVASFTRLMRYTQPGNVQTRLLMRELLDNRHRAETATQWYLKPLLTHLMQELQHLHGWQDTSDTHRLSVVYALLGAMNYYAISAPTLIGIFGMETYTQFQNDFESTMHNLIANSLLPPKPVEGHW